MAKENTVCVLQEPARAAPGRASSRPSPASLPRRVAPPRRTWTGAVLAALPLVGLVLAAYWPVLERLVEQWAVDPNYSHGFLIPVMAAYFVYERGARLQHMRFSPSWVGVAVLAGGLLLFVVGQAGADLFLQRVSLVVVIAALVLGLLGRPALRVLSFPIAFLLFMIPLPAIVLNAVALPLQGFAAQTATFCLAALDIPVLREGHVITLANTSLEVAEACSGIRSLMSLLTLATVYAYFTEPVAWKQWAIVVAAVPVAIAANAFRVAGTGVLAHYVGQEAAQGFYHDFSGWLVFVVAFVLLLGIAAALRRLAPAPAGAP
jgi:exosortase